MNIILGGPVRTGVIVKDQTVEWSETFDDIKEGVAIIDTEHNILRANNAFAKMIDIWCNGSGARC